MTDNTLSDPLAVLDAAAITRDVATAAGVRAITDLADVPPEFGWLARQFGPALLPALVFPWRRPDGQVVTELRPAAPLPGRDKYEWPYQVPLALNVHPHMAGRVADVTAPLLIVEGTKQYLAAVSALAGQHIAAVGIHGCHGWLQDGAPIADLAGLPWEGRAVILALDADVKTNRRVWDAADGLARMAEAYGAASVRHLETPGTGKAGLDDVLSRAPDPAAMLSRLIGSAGKRPRRPAAKKVAPVAPGKTERYRDTLPDLGSSAGSAGSALPGPPADGAALLDETIRAITRYVVFRDDAHAAAAALYVAATHAVSQLQFAPRLRVKSPVKRCGKTLLLDVLSCLAHRPLPTANVSAAALVRSIGADPSTLVLDEMDAVFGTNAKGDEKAETLRGVLNAGFGRGKPYIRYDANSGQVESFPTFAMAIIAGIGDLPDTIEDRAIIVPLVRKTGARKVARFRIRQHTPGLRDLGARLAAWIGPLAATIGAAEPSMPPGMSDRAEDTWEPLIAVADVAGGHWPALAREVARVMAVEAATADADQDTSTRLLADVREVFGDADKLHTIVILARLAGLSGSPWGDWSYGRPISDRQLAAKLRGFEIRPKDVKIDEVNRKGYYRDHFRSAWAAYAPGQPGQQSPPALSVTPNPGPEPTAHVPAGSGVSATGATSATAQVNGHMPVALAEAERYQRYPEPSAHLHTPEPVALPGDLLDKVTAFVGRHTRSEVRPDAVASQFRMSSTEAAAVLAALAANGRIVAAERGRYRPLAWDGPRSGRRKLSQDELAWGRNGAPFTTPTPLDENQRAIVATLLAEDAARRAG